MRFSNIGNRGIMFTYENSFTCDLNLYGIKGTRYNYVIDTGLGSLQAQPIKEFLKDSEKQTIVINTHFHFDHVWGNGVFQNEMIVSHSLCRKLMSAQWDQMLQDYAQRSCGDVQMELPNLVFHEELYFTEDGIRLFHSPGHTPDSVSILDERDRTLFVGDNIGENMEDLIPTLACEKEIYKRTIQNYLTLDFDQCVSGHNVALKRGTIEKILSMLEV